MVIKNYKDLIVWQKSYSLVMEVYKLTVFFPKSEMFGLTSQIKRAAVSISSNIAEGYERRYHNELIRFLFIAIGSAAELENQLSIAKDLKLTAALNFQKSESLLLETIKLIHCFIKKLKNI